jgi:SAM-dependent methyltransferase
MSPIPTINLPTRRKNLVQRFFAWMTAHRGNWYENLTAVRKQALFGGLQGSILELGPGTGPNLRYYPPGVRWTGVEPNEFMHPYLLQSLRALNLPLDAFEITQGDPQGIRLPAQDASLDAVVCTLVLCSVPDPAGTLGEIIRVLKPGGKFIFIEHVAAAPATRLRRSQDFFQPFWTTIGDGCHPNRDTETSIQRAGFGRVEIDRFLVPAAGITEPHIAGLAEKRNL